MLPDIAQLEVWSSQASEIAVQFLKVSRATVYALTERGELVARRVGLTLRLHHDEVLV